MSITKYLIYALFFALSTFLAACQGSGTTVREFDVQSGDVTLHGRLAGDPNSGCVLVAINGGPGLTSNYMLDLEQLAGRDCAVVTYDQRGMGKSSKPAVPDSAESYTLFKYAEDVEAIRLELKAERIHLFGHSFGGIIAMQYAVLYPEHVNSMIFFGGGPPTWEGIQTCDRNMFARIQSLDPVWNDTSYWISGLAKESDPLLPAYFSDLGFTFPEDLLGSAPEFDKVVNDLTYRNMRKLNLHVKLAPLQKRIADHGPR